MSVQGADGPGALAMELAPVDSLTEDPENARDHSDPAGVEAIKRSLVRFKQRKPIVVWRERPGAPALVTKAGNGTLIAARALGWRNIWVAWADGMTLEEADAYALADNQTQEMSRWDMEKLSAAMARLEQPLQDATGFNRKTIELLLQGKWDHAKAAAEPLPGEPPQMGKPIHVTAAQREVIEEACGAVRAREGDASITEGRCLELLSADFLAGA